VIGTGNNMGFPKSQLLCFIDEEAEEPFYFSDPLVSFWEHGKVFAGISHDSLVGVKKWKLVQH
jgi:hypothetical protein